MSCFIVRKPNPGLSVGQHIDKLGYRGVDTGELIFDDCPVGEEDLIGGKEGRGFPSGDGRIGIGPHQRRCARRWRSNRPPSMPQYPTPSVAKPSESPIAQHQAIQLKLAEMGTKIEAARLLTMSAAQKKDAGERVDLAAGMAKLLRQRDMRRSSNGCHADTWWRRIHQRLPPSNATTATPP